MPLKTIRKIIHVTIGSTLLIAGLVGLVLPVLNGIIFLIIGGILISFESPYVEKKLIALTKKNKKVHALHLMLEKKLRSFFGKSHK